MKDSTRWRVFICQLKDLSEEEQMGMSNNGSGREYADYLVIEDQGHRVVYSDAMEPEDCKFSRDLKWIKPALEYAYLAGKRPPTP
jgi:hypothetical protein